jgi:lysophospholipase L1-like esterase
MFQLIDYRIGVMHGPHHRRYRAIMGGEIDGNPGNRARLGPNARAHAVRTLVERCQDRGLGVVFVISPVPEDLEGVLTAEIRLYRQVIRDAAGAADAELVEGGQVFARTGRPASELFLDGVHPTAFGHRILGRAVARTLGRWIRGEPAGGGARGGALPRYPEPGQEAD